MYFARGGIVQKGRGFGGIFRGLLKTVLPVFKKIIGSTTVQNLASTGLKSLANSGLAFAADAISGEDMRESLNRNLSNVRHTVGDSLRNLSSNAMPAKSKARPAKRKRKKPKLKPAVLAKKKRRRAEDIFD